ncbi:unnamed protein product [Closterium sp. NIES-53]
MQAGRHASTREAHRAGRGSARLGKSGTQPGQGRVAASMAAQSRAGSSRAGSSRAAASRAGRWQQGAGEQGCAQQGGQLQGSTSSKAARSRAVRAARRCGQVGGSGREGQGDAQTAMRRADSNAARGQGDATACRATRVTGRGDARAGRATRRAGQGVAIASKASQQAGQGVVTSGAALCVSRCPAATRTACPPARSALVQPARRARLLRASRPAAACTSRPAALHIAPCCSQRVAPYCSQRVTICCPARCALLQPARPSLLQPACCTLLPLSSRFAALRVAPCCSQRVEPYCSQRVALCCPARRALLQPARRALLPHTSRPAALSTAHLALQPAARPTRPGRAAQPEPPCLTRAVPPYLDHQPHRAALLPLLLLLVEVLLGVLGVLLVLGVLEVRLRVLEVLLVPDMRVRVPERLGVDSGGHCLSRTPPPLSSFVSGFFSEPVQVVEALVFYVLHRGGSRVSRTPSPLTCLVSCFLSDVSLSAAALGARASPATGPSSAEALHSFTLDSGVSHCFFRDCTTLTPLAAPVQISLADPTWGPVRAAPHSSEFPSTTAPLQTLHKDVWDSAPVGGTDQECYFLLVVDDYTRYTTVFPLRRKANFNGVLIPSIRATRRQLRERFSQDFPVLHLHSDRGGEFSSYLLAEFCRDEGIAQSFTLPTSPKKNGIAERRIGLIMEVARTSMIHAAAPHFLGDLAHTLVDASVFRVWGALSLVRDAKASKLSSRTLRCVFLGFPTDAPPWQFCHPRSRRVFSSQDITFDKYVIDPLPPQGPARSGVSQVDSPPLVEPLEISSDSSGPAEGGDPATDDTAATRRSPRLETLPGFLPRPSSPPSQPGGAATGGADSGDPAIPSGGGAMVDPIGGPGAGQPLPGGGGYGPAGARAASPGGTAGARGTGGTAGGAAGAGGTRGAAGAGGAGAASLRGSTSAGGTGPTIPRGTVGAGDVGAAAGARGAGAGGNGGAGAAGPRGARNGGAGAAKASGVVRAGGATGAAGSGGTRGTSSERGAGAVGVGGTVGVGCAGGATRAAGTGGAGGTAGAGGAGAGGTGGTGGVGAAGPGGARTRGDGAAEAGGVAGAGGATGATGTGGAGGTAGATAAGGARAAGTALRRPFFYPQPLSSLPPPDSVLRQVLSLLSSTGLPLPLLCPPTDHSQPQLLPGSPLLVLAPHTEVNKSLTECREPETRSSTPGRACRVARPRPPAVPGTHGMALRPSSVPLRVVLLEPPVSSLPHVRDPESNLARAASATVTRLLATVVTDPDLEFTTAFALFTELVNFAARFRLDYVASLVTESEPVCPPSVGGELAIESDIQKGDPDALDIPTPRSYADAIAGEYSSQWKTPMDAAMASWKCTGTYIDEVPPPGANIVDGMWIFRGVDIFHTFSPTPKMTTLRMLLHVAAQCDYELHSLNFSKAFLQGSLHEEIWLRRPPGFTGSFPAGTQWSLRRPVYGLRQAPREWHDTPRTTLAALGFAPSSADPSLFLRTDTTLPPFYVLVYFDDLVFSTADTEVLAQVKAELQERHTCTDLGELRGYLGLPITRDRARRTITLTQSHMVHQVLQHFGFQFSSPQPTPLSTGHSLSAPPLDESVEPSGPYPELVGCLIHQKVHWDAAKRVLHYLCSTLGMGLVLGGHGSVQLGRDLRWGHGCAGATLADLPADRLGGAASFSSSSQRPQLRLSYVASQANTADVFTKAVGSGDHQPSMSCPTAASASHSAAPRVALCCPTCRALLPCTAPPPNRPAATTAAAASRATAAAGGGATGSAGSAASTGGAGGATGSAGGATGSTRGAAGGGGAGPTTGRHCLSRPLSRQVQRLRVDSRGHCLSQTTPPLSSFETFSPQVLSELFPQRCVTGSVEAAALGTSESTTALDASESAAALGASESAEALGARASPATGPSSTEALHTFTLDSGMSRCFFRDCTTLTPLAALVSRAAPHSFEFPPTTAPLQFLHVDVWGQAPVGGMDQERYFLLVVDDYTRYTTVFPLRLKANFCGVLIPSVRATRCQLRERSSQDFPVLRLHSDRGGEFSSYLFAEFCQDEGIVQSFTLPASPQQNGIAEHRIGLIMEVPHTSMIHATVVICSLIRCASTQTLAPCLLARDLTHTLVDASVFRVWGALSLVRDAKASKLSSCTLRCVFLGFPTDAPPWQFCHPRSRRVFSSQDITFDKYSHPPVDPLPPQGPARSAEGGDPATDDTAATRRSPCLETLPGFPPRPSSPPQQPGAVDSRAKPAGAKPGGAETEGEGSGGAATGGADSGDPASPSGGGAMVDPIGGPGAGQPLQPDLLETLLPQEIRAWIVRRGSPGGGGYGPVGARAASPGGTAGARGTGGTAGGGAGAGGTKGAAGAGGAGATSLRGSTGAGGTGPTSPRGTVGAGGVGSAAGAGGAGAGGTGGVGVAGPGGARTGGAGAAKASGVVCAGGANGAAGSGGTGGTAGAGGAGAAGAGGTAGAGSAGGDTRAGGTGGAGGSAGASGAGAGGTGGTGGVGAAGPRGARTRGDGAARAGGVAGARGATGATGTGGAGGAGGTAGAAGAGGAGAAGTALRRPFFYLQLLTSLPPPDSVLRQLLPSSPMPVLSPHTEVNESLTERREPETRSSTPVRARRVARPCLLAVPGTHGMALRPSSVPLRVDLLEPPASSLPHVCDPESNLAHAASGTVTRLLAIVVTDPDLESTTAFALFTELVNFAARSRLDYVASPVT